MRNIIQFKTYRKNIKKLFLEYISSVRDACINTCYLNYTYFLLPSNTVHLSFLRLIIYH